MNACKHSEVYECWIFIKIYCYSCFLGIEFSMPGIVKKNEAKSNRTVTDINPDESDKGGVEQYFHMF